MSMVRFATLCDKCKRRSEEYTSWPTCKDCGEHICSLCDIASERTEDERDETLCLDCRSARDQEAPVGLVRDVEPEDLGACYERNIARVILGLP